MIDASKRDAYEQIHRLVTEQLGSVLGGSVLGEEGGGTDSELQGAELQNAGPQNTGHQNASKRQLAKQQLTEWLSDNPEAQQIYLEYIQESVDLRWLLQETPEDTVIDTVAGTVADTAADGISARGAAPQKEATPQKSVLLSALSSRQEDPSRSSLKRLAYAVLPVIAACLLAWFSLPPAGKPSRSLVSPPLAANSESVATFQRATQVNWGTSSFRPETSQRLSIGQELSIESGEIELLFDNDVEVVVRGPSRFCIASANSLIGWRGAFSAVVGEAGKGFTIETPVAQVKDLGTEFGVLVGPQGETQVAVFKGEVDLAYSDSQALGQNNSSWSPVNRLVQGEGMRVKSGGIAERLVSFDSRAFPVTRLLYRKSSQREPLIASVSDNLRDEQSKKFYKVIRSGLEEDSLAFVDRLHEWNGIDGQGLPKEWLDGEYIMPFNDDKFMNELEVTITLARPVVLYLLVSDTITVPDWLVSDFEDTGLDVGLDEGPSRFNTHLTNGIGQDESIDTRFSVWRMTILKPQTVTLGNIESAPESHDGHNMYGIVAVPLNSI